MSEPLDLVHLKFHSKPSVCSRAARAAAVLGTLSSLPDGRESRAPRSPTGGDQGRAHLCGASAARRGCSVFFGGAEVFKPFDNVFLYKHVHMYPAHSRIIIIIIIIVIITIINHFQ